MSTHPDWILEMAFSLYAPSFEGMHRQTTYYQAKYNLTLLCIDLFLHRIREGQFPDTLPEDSPKDPYTQQAYEYVRNEDGFVLSWDKENLSEKREENRKLEYKIQHSNQSKDSSNQ